MKIKHTPIFNPKELFIGTFIPNALLRCPELSSSAKVVYGLLVRHTNKDGACYPKQETIAEECGLTPRRINGIIHQLEAFELIKTQAPTGLNRLKHFHNRYVFLWHPVFNFHRSDTTSPDRTLVSGRSNTSYYIDISPGQSQAVRGERDLKPKKKKEHPRWMKLAGKLHNAISSVHKVNYTSKLHSWAKSFQLLHTRDKIAILRIRHALDWYCKAFRQQDPYLPVANSGESFRKKFLNIEAAMRRAQNSNDSNDGPPQKIKVQNTGRMTSKEIKRMGL